MMYWNFGEASAECYGYMKVLENVFLPTDTYRNVLIHITHTDLDGYGCAAIMKSHEALLERNCIPWCSQYDDVYRTLTNQLGSAIYTVIGEMLRTALDDDMQRAAMDRYITDEQIASCCKVSFTVLITDIGSIHLNEAVDRVNTIMEEYRSKWEQPQYFEYKANVVIVDHHKNPHHPLFNNGSMPGAINDNMIDCAGFRLDYTTGVYVNCQNVSATYLLNYLFSRMMHDNLNVIFADEADVLTRSEEVAGIISRYDTGNFGRWRLPDDMVNNPDTTAILKYVSDETKLNTALYKMKTEEYAKGNREAYEFYDILAKYIVDGESYRKRLYTEELAQNLLTTTIEYNDFVSNLHRVDNQFNKQCELGYAKIDDQLSMPIVLKLLVPIDHIYVAVDEQKPDTKGYPFFTYAKEYMASFRAEAAKQNMMFNDILVVRVNLNIDAEDKVKKIIVSLCSDGTLDCAKLATHNGGGGHKNAAGFTAYEAPKTEDN